MKPVYGRTVVELKRKTSSPLGPFWNSAGPRCWKENGCSVAALATRMACRSVWFVRDNRAGHEVRLQWEDQVSVRPEQAERQAWNRERRRRSDQSQRRKTV